MRKNCASAIDLHSANRLAEALVFSLTRAKPRHKLRLGENYLVILRGYARLLLSHKIFDFAGTLS